ncbi:hypothetical protein DIPPA_23542 [Diplonema papillatum]|nr:hypothetical protein DIPPA_23542 [Diplonema papillatum]
MTSAPSPGGGQSLVKLVQQREMQFSKKLEVLVSKNEELVVAYKHAEGEREVLLERLALLDERMSEASGGLVALKRDADDRLSEVDARFSYLEQGVEERFRQLESRPAAAPSIVDTSAREDAPSTDMSLVEKYLHDALQQFSDTVLCASEARAEAAEKRLGALLGEVSLRDKKIAALQASVRAVAERVGGSALQAELERIDSDHVREEKEMKQRLEHHATSVTRQLENLGRRLFDGSDAANKSLEQKCTAIEEDALAAQRKQATVDQKCASIAAASVSIDQRLENRCAYLDDKLTDHAEALAARCEDLEEKLHRLEAGVHEELSFARERIESADVKLLEAVQKAAQSEANVGKRLQQADAQRGSVVEAQSKAEGRLNTLEGTLQIVNDGYVDNKSTLAAAVARLDAVETKLGSVEARGTTLDGEVKSNSIQQKASSDAVKEMRKEVDRVVGIVQQVVEDVSVMEEKRRQREADEVEHAARIAQLDREDFVDLRRDIELLKDSTPAIDDSRILALVSELDRGKDVLETIVKMQEVKLDQRSDDLEQRIAAVEDLLHATRSSGRAYDEAQKTPHSGLSQRSASGGDGGTPRPTPSTHHSARLGGPISNRYHTLRDAERSSPERAAEAGKEAHQLRTMSPTRRADADDPGTSRTERSASGSRQSENAHLGSTVPIAGGGSGRAVGTPEPGVFQEAEGGIPFSRGPSPSGSLGVVGGHSSEGSGTLRIMQQLLDQQHSGAALSGHAKTVAHEFETSLAKQEEWRSAVAATGRGPPPPQPPQPNADDLYLINRGRSGSLGGSRGAAGFPRHDDATVVVEIRAQIEEKMASCKDVGDERRRLEGSLDKVNQQLSFIQMHFQTLSEKESALAESKQALLAQLESDGSEKADSVKHKLLKMMDDLRQSKHNNYERERMLVDEGSRLRKSIGELREQEKQVSEEIHHLQKMLSSHVPRGRSTAWVGPNAMP